MKRVAKNSISKILGLGFHAVTIAVVATVLAAANEAYGDRTPQLQVKFVKGDKQFTAWFNMKGYEKNEDGSYKIGKDGSRIESPKNTEAALSIIDKLAHDTGIRGDYTEEMLQGKAVGISVQVNGQGQERLKFTCEAEYAASQELASL